jgi:rRNA maturation protein Nop10
MKLKYFINSNNRKQYTLKEKIPDSEENTKLAHYKFIKIRDAPKSNPKFFRRN